MGGAVTFLPLGGAVTFLPLGEGVVTFLPWVGRSLSAFGLRSGDLAAPR